MAGDIYLHSPSSWHCVERSEELSRRLTAEGIEHNIIVGTYQGKGHMWVELHGKILDPSIADTNPKYYKRKVIMFR
jgi:hypothetical protein